MNEDYYKERINFYLMDETKTELKKVVDSLTWGQTWKDYPDETMQMNTVILFLCRRFQDNITLGSD